jgi:hypothetical protein
MLSARMPKIEHLCIKDFSGATAAFLRILADQCFNLKSLTLHFLQWGKCLPPTSAFRLLLQSLIAVEMLDLWGQTWLTDELLLVVATYCKRLRTIAFDGSGLQVTTVTALVRGCPQLTTIHHSIADRTLSCARNRETWRQSRPGLTFCADGCLSSEHWDSLVFDRAPM